MDLRPRRAFSLVEILVVLVILMILAAIILPHYLGGGKTPNGRTVDSPKQRAQGVECASNLRQIRAAYTMATGGATGQDDVRVQSLADLKSQGVSDSMTRCPVGGEPYQFDPATGAVRCVHPGHEQY